MNELRSIYAEMAGSMNRFDWLNRLFTGRHRGRLFGRTQGRVLEVACGVGTNLRYLPEHLAYVGIDLSPAMLGHAAARYESRRPRTSFLEMDAEELSFSDHVFDTVISALSTCTFPRPEVVLREMARVCRPGGRILLLEHGRSSVYVLARLQDWRAEAHFEKHGCRWNQEPLDVVTRAGLEVRDYWTGGLGTLTAIEAVAPETIGSDVRPGEAAIG